MNTIQQNIPSPPKPYISKLLQWNCNGFYNKLGDIKILLSEHQPLILCIQETHLKPEQKCHIPGYSTHRKDYLDGNRACGGVATFIHHSISSENFDLRTNLQAVAATLTIPNYGKILVCNIYLPNRNNFSVINLQELSNQFTLPYILVGDFNAHHELWGSTHTDARGRIIEHFYLQNEHLILLNENSPAYLSMSTGTFSAIDLSFCSRSLARSLEWEVIQDCLASDHFPIQIQF